MEVPIISRLNPTFFISRLLELFKSSFSPQRSSLKWAALLLVFLLFTFTNIASRLKLLLFHPFSPISKTPLSSINLYDDDVSSDGDDSDSPRSSDNDEDEDDDEDEDEFEKDFRKKGDYDFGYNEGQNGKFTRSRRGSFGESISSLTELLTGNVVKFWDDYDYDQGYDSDYDHGPFSGSFAAAASPAGVVVSADTGDYNKLGVNLWDARVRRRRPAVHAQWSRRRPATAAVGVGVDEGKIYVSDDVVGERLVGDIRMADSPLKDLTAFGDVGDEDAWWDADAVSGT